MYRFLPSGNDVSNFIEGTEFNVAGLGICSKLIISLIDIVQKKFNYILPIRYVYGSPSVLWNGGRLSLRKISVKNKVNQIKEEITLLKENDIVPLFTFSNVNLDKIDLEDDMCNLLLEIIEDYKCEVIVSSSLLENYIRIKKAQIPIHASVIKTAFEKNRTINYYEKLSSGYKCYVIHPDDNFDIEKLKLIPKTNAEIILNERCNYGCVIRDKHYLAISEEQRLKASNKYRDSCFLDSCKYIPEYKQSHYRERNISLTLNEAKIINELGYRLLKIQGRTDNFYTYFFDLLRYTLEPNLAFPNIYPIFSYEIYKFIKENKCDSY